MVAKRRYEELQARWRREVLRLPAGPPTHPTSRRPTVEHCLPREADGVTAVEGGWNFLSRSAHDYARRRSSGFAVFDDRLWRNMLSSQPLAFNIAGELRAGPDAAANAFARLAGLPVTGLEPLGEPRHDRQALDGVDAEWAPPRQQHTGDGSGFDLAALLCTGDRRRILLTIEVKYTDDFSPGVPPRDLARRLDQYAGQLDALGVAAGSRAPLLGGRTYQFLRSVMLTHSVVRRGLRGEDRLDGGLAVVLALGTDDRAREVVTTVGSAVESGAVETALWSLEDAVDAFAQQTALGAWAERLRQRYLVGPVGTRT